MVDWNQVTQRLRRIAQFDTTVFAEIEQDQEANAEAAVVVIISSLLAALAAGIRAPGFFSLGAFFGRFVMGVLLYWLLWSLVTMFIGTTLFAGQADFWEMARTLGYANAPAALEILSILPCLGWLIGIATLALSLVIGFFAVRETLDLPTEKALITVLIGWAVVFVAYLILGLGSLGF